MISTRSLAMLFLAAGLTAASGQSYSFTEFASWLTPGVINYGGGWNGVAVDRSGNVFVADFQEQTIRKITADGVVTTVAGVAGVSGLTDGTGSAARFLSPEGVAVDASGNLFVADWNVIRKITAAGVVTTFAGGGQSTSTTSDGVGTSARFNVANCVALDASGNIYVGDRADAIRKITPGGVVTTLAGSPNIPFTSGTADGTGSAARFAGPRGVAVDGSGNVFVADWAGHTLRKVTPAGVVTTLAGLPGNPGRADGTGSAARFEFPRGVTIDASGTLFVADGTNTIRRVTPAGVVTTVAGSRSFTSPGSFPFIASTDGVAVDSNGNLFVIAEDWDGTNRLYRGVLDSAAPAVTTSPQSQHANAGASVTFSVAAGGNDLTYQWNKDGVAISGATTATFTIARAAIANVGFYSVVVTGAGGAVESPTAILTVTTGGTSRLSDLSTRGFVPAGGDLTVGFVVRGGSGKSVLVRAIGPTLGTFGVAGALADPKLDLIAAGVSTTTNSNDDWAGGAALAGAFASVGAFALPAASKDAAVLATLSGAAYSARITSSVAGGSGIAIAEVYDRDAAGAGGQLVNVSTLGFVGIGAQALVPGFVIDGPASKLLLIRAVGPGLAPFGVAGTLADPRLAIAAFGKTFTVASNDNWGGDATLASAFASVGAFALLASSKDAAVIVRLPPGGYTVTVSGVGDTTGRALVEIYDLDSLAPSAAAINLTGMWRFENTVTAPLLSLGEFYTATLHLTDNSGILSGTIPDWSNGARSRITGTVTGNRVQLLRVDDQPAGFRTTFTGSLSSDANSMIGTFQNDPSAPFGNNASGTWTASRTP